MYKEIQSYNFEKIKGFTFEKRSTICRVKKIMKLNFYSQ